MKTAYNKSQAKEYDSKRFFDEQGAFISKLEFSKINSVLGQLNKESSIVEFGCGTCRFFESVTKYFFDKFTLTGIDASDSMLSVAHQKFSEENYIHLYKMNAHDTDFDDNIFDFAYSVRLLNQTQSENYALSVIQEMFRVVKPGGYILVEFVNKNRPLIGRNKTSTTRLSHNQISSNFIQDGVSVINESGLFFFGMGSFHKCHPVLLPLLGFIDKLFSRYFPKLCSRGYILFKKGSV